jgi:hypothetical protein
LTYTPNAVRKIYVVDEIHCLAAGRAVVVGDEDMESKFKTSDIETQLSLL